MRLYLGFFLPASDFDIRISFGFRQVGQSPGKFADSAPQSNGATSFSIASAPYWDWTKPEEQHFPDWLAGVLPTVRVTLALKFLDGRPIRHDHAGRLRPLGGRARPCAVRASFLRFRCRQLVAGARIIGVEFPLKEPRPANAPDVFMGFFEALGDQASLNLVLFIQRHRIEAN